MSDVVASLVAALPLPAILVGGDDRIVAANPAAEVLFGPRLPGRNYVSALRQPALLDLIEGTLRNRRAGTAQWLAREASRDVTYKVTAAPVALSGWGGVLVSFTDTTDLQEAGQIRRDFVANVSHELKTPLTALLGFIETLRGPARRDPAAQERFLGIMETEARRMNRLVQDLLSLSRVETEERVRPTRRVRIEELVSATVSALMPLAKEAGATLEVLCPEPVGDIPGDADQIAQVVSNLVENAIKYGGKDNRVTVALARQDENPAIRGAAVTISVTDTGEGFDPIHIPRLTERFYRIDDHRSREMGGTGLGLAIVKHVVNRHRGRLKIESAPGRGGRFTVILPAT